MVLEYQIKNVTKNGESLICAVRPLQLKVIGSGNFENCENSGETVTYLILHCPVAEDFVPSVLLVWRL